MAKRELIVGNWEKGNTSLILASFFAYSPLPILALTLVSRIFLTWPKPDGKE